MGPRKMKLHIEEETRHEEGHLGAPVAPGLHVARGTAFVSRSPAGHVALELSLVQVYTSIVWERFFYPPLWMFFFPLRE